MCNQVGHNKKGCQRQPVQHKKKARQSKASKKKTKTDATQRRGTACVGLSQQSSVSMGSLGDAIGNTIGNNKARQSKASTKRTNTDGVNNVPFGGSAGFELSQQSLGSIAPRPASYISFQPCRPSRNVAFQPSRNVVFHPSRDVVSQPSMPAQHGGPQQHGNRSFGLNDWLKNARRMS